MTWSEYLRKDLAQAQAGQQIVFVRTQMENDARCGASPCARPRRCRLSLIRALPAHAVFRSQPGAARGQGDAVGDDERRVKADAELPDDLGVFRAVRREPGEELACARLGNRADMVDDFLARHADAVVGHRDRARVRVEADVNLGSGSCSNTAASVIASKRSLWPASDAFNTSSRRKISLFPYRECTIRCSSCLTSAWKPRVSLVGVSVISIQCLAARIEASRA